MELRIRIFFFISTILLNSIYCAHYAPECSSGSLPYEVEGVGYLRCPSTECQGAYECDDETGYCCPKPMTIDLDQVPWNFKDSKQNKQDFKFRDVQGRLRSDLCSVGEVAYLSTIDGKPVECFTSSECPEDYYCSDDFMVCCGPPSQCPDPDSRPVKDPDGRLSSCLISDDCPENSVCQKTNKGQGLCCGLSERLVFNCPISGVPIPDPEKPQQCSPADPFGSCPSGSVCQPSNIPGTNICCSVSSGLQPPNPCPSGWMLLNGVIAFCEENSAGTCPSEATCVRSPSLNQFVCCIQEPLRHHDSHSLAKLRSSTPFSCPKQSQTPALMNSDQNIFCNSLGSSIDCPGGANCQVARDSTGVLICCYQISYQSTIPQCPTGTTAQPGTIGYVPCNLFGGVNQCQTGYVCTASINGGQSLCCSSGTNIPRLLCPNQQSLYTENGNPRFCSPAQASPCPSGYACVESLGAAGVYMCCSTPAVTTCPTGYIPATDTTGNNIFCSTTDINVCPSDSQCLQAQNRVGIFICCRSSSAPRVCPNNQNAYIGANGQLEYCNGPGSVCSATGYSCQLSTTLSTWVCCGVGSQSTAVCADGRETYNQQFGLVYTCNPLTFPSNCPPGYECAQSTTVGISVCCLTSTTPAPYSTFRPPIGSFELECPTGWSAYGDANGAQQFCTGATDMSCPQGFSCAQSSSPGIFLCCRIARNLQCPSGYSTLLINNSPRLCSTTNANSCPSGYSCQKSTLDTVYICCGQQTTVNSLLCADGQIPAYIGANVRYCSRVGSPDICPPSYACAASNRPGYNVCCHYVRERSFSALLREESVVCGSTGIAYFPESNPGKALECSGDPTVCPEDFFCQPSMTDTKMYCCQEAKCPNAGPLPDASVACSSNNDCNSGTICTPAANVPNVNICCSPESTLNRLPDAVESARCLGRMTHVISGTPTFCSSNADCKPTFECSSHTTTGTSICCEVVYPGIYPDFCPDNREPIRSSISDNPISCDIPTSCPTNSICKANPSRSKKYCCSQIPFCQNNTTPQIDNKTGQAKRCFGGVSDCSHGFGCYESTVNNVYVCCSTVSKGTPNTPPTDQGYNFPEKPKGQAWVVLDG